MKKHLSNLCQSLLLAGLATTLVSDDSHAAKPNVVVIHIDDLDFDEIGAYQGKGKVWTPNLDALVNGGLKFNRGYVTSPVCVPSRYSTITGRYASRNMYHERNTEAAIPLNIENIFDAKKTRMPAVIDEHEYTFARLMKDAGYTTGMIGKWHSDPDALQRPMKGIIEGDPRDPEVAAAVRKQYEEILARVKRRSGFDVVDRLIYDNKEQMLCPEELRTMNSAWMTEGAVNFIDANKDQPFFLYYSNPIPHGQLVQPDQKKKKDGLNSPGFKRWVGTNAIKGALATPAGYLEKVPDVQPPVMDAVARFEANVPDKPLQNAIITWMDDSVGAIINKLKAEGLYENTVIFFISDHQSVDKFTPYEQGAHVPFAIHWAGKTTAGTESDSLVASIDIFATMADIVGAKLPEGHQIDGVSMLPLIDDPKATIREDIMIEIGFARSVLTKDHHYIATRFPDDVEKPTAEKPQLFTGGDRVKNNGISRADGVYDRHPDAWMTDQFYDLKRDPKEVKSVADHPEYAPIIEKLKKRLSEYLKDMPHAFADFKN